MNAEIDCRRFTGFGIDQCPSCGSKNVTHEATKKAGGRGGGTEHDLHEWMECGDCGWTGDTAAH